MSTRHELIGIKAPLLKSVTIPTVFAQTGGNVTIHRFFETRGGNCREAQKNAIGVSEWRRLQRDAWGAQSSGFRDRVGNLQCARICTANRTVGRADRGRGEGR